MLRVWRGMPWGQDDGLPGAYSRSVAYCATYKTEEQAPGALRSDLVDGSKDVRVLLDERRGSKRSG